MQASSRGFAGGGPKKPAIEANLTDFDVVFVGGLNAACVLKFLQSHDDAQDLKMALVSNQGRFVEPFNYFACTHAHQGKLLLESPSISALVQTWSKAQAMTNVTGLDADACKLNLSNGKEFTYKSLVLAPGFDH